MSNYTEQELQLLTDKVTTLFNSNDNWKGIGVQHKEKNGQLTGDLAITLTVDKKLPAGELDSNDLFPESITIPGITDPVQTDVQVGETEFTAEPICYTLPTPGSDESGWVMPVSGSRQTHRPIMGGIGCSIMPPNGYSGGYVDTGTLGGLCIDLDDNTVVGVSNNHVLGGYQLRGDMMPTSAYENANGLTYWSLLSANDTTESTGETRYPVYQRSSYDEYTSTKSSLDDLKIGTVKRAYPFTSSNNKLDVAVFALDTTVSNLFSKTESWKQYLLARQDEDMVDAVQGLSALGFATTAEIDSLMTTQSGAPCFKSGRTYGPLGWPGSEPYGSSVCSLSAYTVTYAGNVSYSGNLDSLGFIEQIRIRGTTDASAGGDSGSFWCALFNEGNPSLSAWKIIGLHFAGGGDVGMANRIDNVTSMFNLSAYRGEDLDIGYKNTDIKIIDTRQSAVTARIGGKMYWQAGSTNSSATGRFDT